MKLFIKSIPALYCIIFLLSCKKEKEEQLNYTYKNGVEYSSEKDARIQQYNLDQEKKLTKNSSSCDTLSLKEYILKHYPIGTYLLNSDKTLNFSISKPAVIYCNQDYYEYIYYDSGERVYSKDSVAFVWKENDNHYVNTKNHKQTRLY